MKRLIYILLAIVLALPMSAKPKFSYLSQRAAEAYQNGEYETALQYCQEAVKQDKKDALAWALMAETYTTQSCYNLAEAIQAADNAIRLTKDASLRSLCYELKGKIFMSLGEVELGKEAYKQAIALNPTDLQMQYDFGMFCYKNEDYDETIAIMKQILQKEPYQEVPRAAMGSCYVRKGDYESAEEALRWSLILTKDNTEQAYAALALMAYRKHDIAKAAEYYAQLLKAGDEMPQDITEVSDSLERYYPHFYEAVYRRYQAESPVDAERMSTLGRVYWELGNFLQSLYWLEKSYQQDDRSMNTIMSLAITYNLIEDTESAMRYINAATALDSTDSAIPMYKAEVLQIMGRYEDALAAHHKDISLNPDNADSYRLCGRLLMQMDRYEEALAYMDTAVLIAKDANYATCLFNRGEVLERLGRDEAAQAVYQAALTVEDIEGSTRSYVYAHLGMLDELNHYADSVSQPNICGQYTYRELSEVYACTKDKEKTLYYLRKDFENGTMLNPTRIRTFYRFDFLKGDADLEAFLAEVEARRQELLDDLHQMLKGEEETGVTEIPFTEKGGVNEVRCSINGLPLYFVFDTGASDVSISAVEANFMLRNDYLTDADFMGVQNYMTANGEIHEGTIINLREVRIGDLVLHDIKASVVKSQHAPLLLGQSVFRRFGTLEVDNQRKVIVFKK